MSKTKILIVEDEGIISQSLEYLLLEMGYAVTEIVTSGEEAIRSAKENPPDLVLMDIQLGTEMDGVEATKIIQQQENAPPIIYLTAFSDEQTISRAKITTPFAFITKPFETRELQICIEVALHNNRMEKTLQQTQSRLKTVINNIEEGLITARADGRIDLVNQAAEQLLNIPSAALLGKNLSDTIKIVSKSSNQNTGTSNVDFSKITPGPINLRLGPDHYIKIEGVKDIPVKSGSVTALLDDSGNSAGMIIIFK